MALSRLRLRASAAVCVWLGAVLGLAVPAVGQGARPVGSGGPVWTQLGGLPAEVKESGSGMYLSADGYLYLMAREGKSPHIVNRIYRSRAADGSSWTEITGKGLPGGGAAVILMGSLANGVPLAETTTGRGNADVYFWDGASRWKPVKGWTGQSSSHIYEFVQDAAGNTYFSPAWSGDIWRTTSPNTPDFKQVMDKLYGYTNGGGADHPMAGGLYQMRIWDLGDGRGETLWTCGEGELENIDLRFRKWTAYLTEAQGYKANCTSIDRSAKSIGVFRMVTATGEVLNKIDIATRKVKVIPAEVSGFPVGTSNNAVGTLHWMNGDTWVFSSREDGGQGKGVLAISRDDLETWHDLTAEGGMDESCRGVNLSHRAVVSEHYVFARCQNGRAIWRYGPI